jgi:hypothetical protein
VPYSFESSVLYSGLSTRFEAAESHSLFRGMRGRGSCIFRCLLLSRDAFASSTRPCGHSKSRLLASFRLATASTHSGGERHLRWALPFGPSSPRDAITLRRPHPRCTSSFTDELVLRRSHPGERASSCDDPHPRVSHLPMGSPSPCSHLAMSSRHEQLTLR